MAAHGHLLGTSTRHTAVCPSAVPPWAPDPQQCWGTLVMTSVPPHPQRRGVGLLLV